MRLDVTHQDSYSRGELLLRTFFGWLYIGIPHFFLLFFLGIWSGILGFIKFWIVLFTGNFPQGIFEYQYDLKRWQLRANATLFNLVDGYPSFGLKGTSDKVTFDLARPEKVSQGLVLLRALFGWLYVGIPHGFCLVFRMIGMYVLVFLAWWAVLFTGKYPARWHAYNVGTLRWATRISLYLGFFTDDYPPFTGKEMGAV